MVPRRRKLWIGCAILLILAAGAVWMCRPLGSHVKMDPDQHQYWTVHPHQSNSYELDQEEIRRLYNELDGVLLFGPLPPKRAFADGRDISLYTAQTDGANRVTARSTVELFLEQGDRISINIDEKGYVILSGRGALREVFQALEC